MNALQEAIQNYFAVRTANATGLTVEQVKTLDSLEANYPTAPLDICVSPVGLRVCFADDDGFPWDALVNADGTLDYQGGLQ